MPSRRSKTEPLLDPPISHTSTTPVRSPACGTKAISSDIPGASVTPAPVALIMKLLSSSGRPSLNVVVLAIPLVKKSGAPAPVTVELKSVSGSVTTMSPSGKVPVPATTSPRLAPVGAAFAPSLIRKKALDGVPIAPEIVAPDTSVMVATTDSAPSNSPSESVVMLIAAVVAPSRISTVVTPVESVPDAEPL